MGGSISPSLLLALPPPHHVSDGCPHLHPQLPSQNPELNERAAHTALPPPPSVFPSFPLITTLKFQAAGKNSKNYFPSFLKKQTGKRLPRETRNGAEGGETWGVLMKLCQKSSQQQGEKRNQPREMFATLCRGPASSLHLQGCPSPPLVCQQSKSSELKGPKGKRQPYNEARDVESR